MQKLSEKAISLAPWSPSRLNTADDCPFRYNCEVNKLPIKTFPDDTDARIGTALHTYIEILLSDPKRALSKDFIYSLFEDNSLTHKEVTRFNLLKESAETSAKRIIKFKKSHNITDDNFHVELGLAINHKFEPTKFLGDDVFLRGKIDLAMLTPEGVIAVLDHKSGTYSEITDHYKKQLDAYMILYYYAYHRVKANDKRVKSFVGYLNAIGGDSPDILRSDEVLFEEFDEKIKSKFIEYINRVSDSLESNEAKPGNHCKYCSFIDKCPLNIVRK